MYKYKFRRIRLLCGTGGCPPNVMQPTEAYCTNPALVLLPLHLQRRSTEKELWARNVRSNLAYKCDFRGNCRVLLHAAKLQRGTDGFTSPPEEGMLRIFSPEKSDDFGRVPTCGLGYQRPAC
jgi:hypothetical protein